MTHKFIHRMVCPFYEKNQLYTELSTLSTITKFSPQTPYGFYRKILFLYTSDKLKDNRIKYLLSS